MTARRILITLITFILIGSVFVGATSAREAEPTVKAALENVRDYVAASSPDGVNYAVDSGNLFAGSPLNWTKMSTPSGVIVSSVAADAANANVLYIGAANEMALYRSANAGQNWERLSLSVDIIGGVTDVAVDSAQRLVYVGTDNGGVYRLRDVGSSLILSSQLLLDEEVVEIEVDSTGSGMAFVRTPMNLYRAENFGLSWKLVDNLGSTPTAVEIANGTPATIYVGTTDRGLVKSNDGLEWTLANEGLGLNPGTRLQVDALSIDPAQPNVLYVATSYNFGSTTVHSVPVGVSASNNEAASWTVLTSELDAPVAELLPVSGMENAVYALTTASRSPLALGNAPSIATDLATVANVAAEDAVESSTASTLLATARGMLAWIVAGLAALALLFAAAFDLRSRRRKTVQRGTLAPSMVSSAANSTASSNL